MKIQILDHGYVEFIESWGSDEAVVAAARMSTDGAFRGWGPHHASLCNYTADPTLECNCATKPGDEKLLRYLWEHGHHTPFEMGGLVIEVQLPIFVARQWMRSRTFSYNELSARYTEMPDLFYVPSMERLRNGGQAKSNKQASGTELDEATIRRTWAYMESANNEALFTYRSMLADGVSRELARLVLPVNAYTRMRVSGNVRNWLHFLNLRLDSAAQYEIRVYADAVGKLVEERFPRTWALFQEGRK